MKNIGRYIKKYKIETIFAPLFKLLEASFELLIPIVMTKIIDIGIVNKDINYIIHMCLVMVSLGVIGFICSVTAQYFAAKAAVGVGTLMREDLFAHINKLSFSDLDAIGTSTLIDPVKLLSPLEPELIAEPANKIGYAISKVQLEVRCL